MIVTQSREMGEGPDGNKGEPASKAEPKSDSHAEHKEQKADQKAETKLEPTSARSEISEVAIAVDPEVAHFPHSGGKSEHMVVNFTKQRMAIKVRCGNNAVYRVDPVYMFIESGKCRNLIVTRLPGPAKQDKLILQYAECDEKMTDVKSVFKELEAAGKKISNIKVKLMATANAAKKVSREVIDE
ncbi:unnamed protein product [Caenorhabditis auriculariae]|uniref:Major sperm protein n=1 Tax=Caenorhabditis auriculariae TaxID=2777116 RepID=A0A8S1HJQ0_9PELO|nr:unnamed protein product [Caenorhabditis auriculariae]